MIVGLQQSFLRMTERTVASLTLYPSIECQIPLQWCVVTHKSPIWGTSAFLKSCQKGSICPFGNISLF